MMCWGFGAGWTHWVIGVPFHDQFVPPPVPIKGVIGLLDGPAPISGWPGINAATEKVGKKTYFNGNPAIQQTHDVGYLIPHIALPFNAMMAINTVLSKHKVMFPVRSVIVEGKPMGTYVFMFLGLICSQPVSLPTGVVSPWGSTVISNLNLGDIVLGFAFIAVDVVIDLLWSMVFKGDKVQVHWPTRRFGKNIVESDYKLLFTRQLSKLKLSFVKSFLDSAGGKVSGLTKSPVLGKATEKLLEHMGKSWALSPLVAGGIFQSAQPLTGLSRSELPGISIGRAGANVQFFPKLKVGGNIFN